MLNVWNVNEDKSLISVDVSLLNSLISLESSLDVYPLKSAISLDVNDFATLISIDVSLDKSEISVLSV